jgi:hypothetical protein
MRHIGEKRLKIMQNKGMVEGFLECNFEVDFCKHCICGKKIVLGSHPGRQGQRGFKNWFIVMCLYL